MNSDLGYDIGYKAETAYASGRGAVALGETALQTGDLTTFDRVFSASIAPAKPVREERYDLGASDFPSSIETLGIGPGKITIKQLLQTNDMFDLWRSGSKGAIQDSIAIHVDNAIIEFDAFGCVVESIDLSIVSKSLVIQTTTFLYRSLGDGGTVTAVGYQTGSPAKAEDVSFTIDAITSATLIVNSLTLTLTNIYIVEEKMFGIGNAKIQRPAIEKRQVAISISYLDLGSNTWGALTSSVSTNDAMNTTNQRFDAAIVWCATLTTTITNIMVNDDNSGSHEQSGVKYHDQSFKHANGCTVA